MGLVGDDRGFGQEFVCCCGLGMQLLDAVVIDTLGWMDWE